MYILNKAVSSVLTRSFYCLVEFTPLAKMQVAHHMLLFGCEEPFKKDTYW